MLCFSFAFILKSSADVLAVSFNPAKKNPTDKFCLLSPVIKKKIQITEKNLQRIARMIFFFLKKRAPFFKKKR